MKRHRILSLIALALILLVQRPAWAPPPSVGRPGTRVLQYNASYSPPSRLPALCLGQTIIVPVVVVNQGNLPWDIYKFHLSYHWYAVGAVPPGTVPTSPAPDYGAVVFRGLRTQLQNLVAPGQRVTLQAQLQAPPTAGTYTLKWDMLQAGTTWFSTQGVATTDQTVAVSDAHCLKARPGRLAPAVRDITIVDCASIRCAAGTHCEATGMVAACVPDAPSCNQVAFCVKGSHWDSSPGVCGCVPDAQVR